MEKDATSEKYGSHCKKWATFKNMSHIAKIALIWKNTGHYKMGHTVKTKIGRTVKIKSHLETQVTM